MKEKTKESVSKTWKILLGLILIAAGVSTYIIWPGMWDALKWFVAGVLGVAIVFIGLLFLLVGITE